MTEGRVRLSVPRVTARTHELVSSVLTSGQLATGPMVRELERRIAELSGTNEAVAVSSGTAALEAIMQFSVSPGDVVVTTPFTFAATVNAVLSAGATVRFADIDPDDMNLSPSAVSAALDESVRAVLAVHLFGQPCDLNTMLDVLPRGVLLLEDAAQAIGARIGNRPVGSWGPAAFSLYATKNVCAGEGGVVTTDDSALARSIRMYANQGMSGRYDYAMVGTNLRLTDLAAAVAVAQLEEYDQLLARRQANARLLSAELTGIDKVTIPIERSGWSHAFHQYTIRVPAELRDAFVTSLDAAGIDAGVYYPRILNDYDIYGTHPRVEARPTPEAARAAGEVVSLPVHPQLAPQDLERIVVAVRSYFGA